MLTAGGIGKFTCPTCGGHNFRTDIPKNTGYCRGESLSVRVGPRLDRARGYAGCRFSWSRTDDAKYFDEMYAGEGGGT